MADTFDVLSILIRTTFSPSSRPIYTSPGSPCMAASIYFCNDVEDLPVQLSEIVEDFVSSAVAMSFYLL